MRLIDADALLEDFAERQNLDCSDGEFCDCFLNSAQEVSTAWWCVEDAVESAPAIDAAPVVHARWVPRGSADYDAGMFYCSACKDERYFGDEVSTSEEAEKYGHFCPNCGAKMDEKEAATRPVRRDKSEY